MMEQAGSDAHVGVVTHLDGDSATVRFTRSKMCAHCGACLAVGEKELELSVKNTLDARVGDRVAVAVPPKRVVQASVIAYVIPLALLLTGVWLGSLLSDVAALLCGVGACALAYFLLRLLERKRRDKTAFAPGMTAIVEMAEEDRDNKATDL